MLDMQGLGLEPRPAHRTPKPWALSLDSTWGAKALLGVRQPLRASCAVAAEECASQW